MKNDNSKSLSLAQLSVMLEEGVLSREEYERAVALLSEGEGRKVGADAQVELSSMTPQSARLKESEQHGAVRSMSPMRFDIEHVNKDRLQSLTSSGVIGKLRQLSVTSASILGVLFVTLSIGFTNLDPTVAMKNDVAMSKKMDKLGVRKHMQLPVVKRSSIREERLPYNAYIEPVFGPDAVARCVHACNVDGGSACADTCKKHSASSYFNAAVSSGMAVENVLEKVAKVCADSTPRFESNRTRLAWGANVKATMHELREYPRLMQGAKWGEVKLRYNRLNQLNRRLALPWGANEEQKTLVGLLSEATCVRMHLASVEMELLNEMAAVSSNEDYLSSMREVLRDHAVTREVELLRQVHDMRESAKHKS